MERGFKGVWIPKNIWLSKELNMTEKCLLIEVESLSSTEEGCYASNQFLGNFLGLTKNTISNIVSGLVKKGFITVEIKYFLNSKIVDRRIIKITKKFKYLQSGLVEGDSIYKKMDTPTQKNLEGYHEKKGTPPHEKVEESNTSFFSNTKKTTTKLGKSSKLKISSSNDFSFLEKKDYSKLNQVTKSNIMKALPNLKEKEFNRCYNLTLIEVTSGVAEDFNAVLYQGLLGIWIFKAGTLKKDTSKNKTVVKVLTDYEKSVKKYKEKILYKIDSNPKLGPGWKNGFRFEISKFQNIEEVDQLLAKYQIKVE